jgi:virginiamycin B lyase
VSPASARREDKNDMNRKPAMFAFLLAISATLSGHGAANGADRHLLPGQLPISALPIVERIKVPVGPAWLETGYGSVWVSKIDTSTLLRIDPATNKVVATITVGSQPELGIGIGFGSVWIADTKDRTLTQIDPAANKIVRTIPVNIPDETEGSIGLGEGSIWLLTNENGTDSGTLSRLDPVSGNVTANIRVKPKSHAAVVAFGAVWVTSSVDGTVARIDPRKNAVVAEIPVHALPRFLAAGADSLWVLSQSDGTLARIDPLTNRVVATVEVGVPGEGGDLSIAEGYVWVSAEGVPLSQIDPRTNKLIRQYVGGVNDDTLRVDFGSAWIVDELNGQVWRIALKKLVQ